MSSSERDFNDEFISAYLDGELNDTERDRVEQLMEESADCRRTCDELRSVRDELKSLPRHTLDDDFYLRVLHQTAQRRQGESSADVLVSTEPLRPDTAPYRSRRDWRFAIWPLTAVAATVLVVLLVNSGINQRRLVQSGRAPAEPALEIAEGELSGLAEELDSLGTSPKVAESADKQRGFGEDLRQAEGVGSPRFALPPEAARSESGRGLTEMLGEFDAARQREKAPAPVDKALDPRSRYGRERSQQPDADAAASKMQGGVSELDGDDVAVQTLVEAMGDNQVDVIVQVNVAQAAIGNEALDASLTRNNIMYAPNPSTHSWASLPTDEEAVSTKPKDAAGSGSGGFGAAGFGTLADTLSVTADQLRDPQLIYVEAPVEQISATVTELENNRKQFLDVKLFFATHLDESRLGAFGVEHEGLAAQDTRAKSSQNRRFDRYYFVDTAGRPKQRALKTRTGQALDPSQQNTQKQGRAQRILVRQLMPTEGRGVSDRGVAPARANPSAPTSAEPTAGESASDAERFERKLGQKPGESLRRRGAVTHGVVKPEASDESLQALFVVIQQQVQAPFAAESTEPFAPSSREAQPDAPDSSEDR